MSLDVLIHIFLVFFPLIFLWLYTTIGRKTYEKQKQEQAQKEKEKWEKERSEYIKLYGSKHSIEISEPPAGHYVDNDNLPCSGGEGKWGSVYTFYMTGSGKTYHSASCHFVKKYFPLERNAFQIKEIQRFKHPVYPCSYCGPELPKLDWYMRYRDIYGIKHKYKIPEPYEYQLPSNLAEPHDPLWPHTITPKKKPSHSFRLPKPLDQKNLERARTEYMYFPNGCCEGSNLIETLGEESPYYVSPYDCTCKSFKYGRAPCKHMYRLWIELGYLE